MRSPSRAARSAAVPAGQCGWRPSVPGPSNPSPHPPHTPCPTPRSAACRPIKLMRPGVSPQPLHACLAINAWLLVMGVVAVPLCILYALERRARQRFWGEAARVAREAQAAGASTAAAVRATANEAPGPMVPTFPLTGLWPFDVYIYSCLVWALAEAVYRSQ